MANIGSASNHGGNRSSGFALGGALLALAPAAFLNAGSVEWQDPAPNVIRVTMDQASSVSVSIVTQPERNSDAQLRRYAASAFEDLLQRQSDIEPDIAAVIYAKRSSLYAKF